MRALGPALAALTAAGMVACSSSLGAAGRWTPALAPPQLIPDAAATVALPGGRVAVIGGLISTTGEPASETLLFDSETGRWQEGPVVPDPRTDPVVIAMKDGEVLMAGGNAPFTSSASGEALASAWIFDPVARSWRRTGGMNNARSGANAVLLADGRVLVTGGYVPTTGTNPNLPLTFVAAAETFDPASGVWTAAGSMAREGAVLVALPAGRAIAAGGCQQQTADSGTPFGQQGPPQAGLAAAEIFDGAKWSRARSMPSPRCGASGIELADGSVLVVGGSDVGGPVADAAAFDPRSGAWKQAGSPGLGQAAAPVALEDGRVFLAGVQTGPRVGGGSTLLVGGQVYDPSSGDWTFVTTTSLVTASQFGAPGIAGVVAVPPDGALLLLSATGTTSRGISIIENQTLSLDARAAAPAVSTLDSTGLTWLLLAVVATLLAVLAVARLRSR